MNETLARDARRAALLALAALTFGTGCNLGSSMTSSSFEADLQFLKRHVDVVVLGDEPGGPRVAVVPAFQGRVMTSTPGGPEPASLGWINRELIAAGRHAKGINAYGGEDRFWLGPEAGQYAIFFKTGDRFDLEHWQTPPAIDTAAYDLVSSSASEAVFRHDTTLHNYSGSRFDLRIDRTIRLLSRDQLAQHLGGAALDGLQAVAYESDNRITNTGDAPWTKAGGLLSIWILGMFEPSDQTTVIVPYKGGSAQAAGPIVNDLYFGKVPDDRLAVTERAVFFRGDGCLRSKIGIGPRRALPVLAGYDAGRGLLTLAQYTLPEGATDYVNSMWELQEEPYGGDVVNSYNDGPATPGAKPIGGFYELETSSPAVPLAPGESLRHVHRTIHLTGDRQRLDAVSRALLGVGLDEVEAALPVRGGS